jgi:hypothetical protein
LVLTAYRSQRDALQAEKVQRQEAQQSAAAERQANAQTRLERQRAEANLRKAVQAWGDSLEFLLERPPWKDTPELAAVRKAQTQLAARFMEGLLTEVGNDPTRSHEAAVILATLGGIYHARQDDALAVEAFSASVTLYRQLERFAAACSGLRRM